MKKTDAVKMLDQLQDCLLRAETAKKDVDLLAALRVTYALLEDWIKKEEKK